MKPYVIVSPPFDPVSGGVRVMYGLYGWLLAKGQIAFINQKPVKGDYIAVYPEIQKGNPLGVKDVVRYILAEPGVIPALLSDGSLQYGDIEFDKNEKLYYFSRLYGGDDSNTLFLPVLNLHVFKDQGKKRTKTAYFIGKGINYPLKPFHPDDAILIDRELAIDQQALADVLNQCHTLYCYDPVSAMLEIARLCGVRVIMKNPVYKIEEFRKYEPGMHGINWGEDQGIECNPKYFRGWYENLLNDFNKRIDKFIDETQG